MDIHIVILTATLASFMDRDTLLFFLVLSAHSGPYLCSLAATFGSLTGRAAEQLAQVAFLASVVAAQEGQVMVFGFVMLRRRGGEGEGGGGGRS